MRTGSPLSTTQELLLARPETKRVEIKDDRLKVFVNDPRTDGGYIAETLVGSGLRLLELREDEIGLEEVFLRVTQGATQ